MIEEDALKLYIEAAQASRASAKKALKHGDFDTATLKFREAHQSLDDLQAELAKKVAPDPNDPMSGDRELATLFADLFGIRGGTYRDMAAFDKTAIEKAIAACDEGAAYEREFKLKSTYNYVNQLVVRILSDAELLNNPTSRLTLKDRNGNDQTKTTREWLSGAKDHVEWSVPRRHDKVWAHADLVMLAALGSSPDVDSRWVAFKSQVEQDGDNYPFVSLLAVMRDLVQLPLTNKSVLLRVGEMLRSELPEDKRGEPLGA